MDTERWRALEAHFDEALALPRERRVAFAETACGDDLELRAELMSLLQASDAASTFLEEPADPPHGATPASETLEPGARLGAWRVVRLIGRGGMGEVYEAERADGQFEQRAAVKLTRREASKLLDRFNAERQILARLDHPGIARLLDGGVGPDGRPYAVMEYVEGQVITDYCNASGAGLPERLALFLQVCDAVAYAHRNLIVHRDIKPGNVLVGSDARTRLLDFGIAKPLDVGVWPAGSNAEMTTALLTPDYAAPEQLSGEPVTTATDVYALGVLLFELLVGRRPWVSEGRPLAQVLSTVLETPAPRASEIAAGIKDHRIAPRLLQGDLDAIIAKCLRREPQHRYATVNALKLDIERSLQGDPVTARGDARLYVLGRFARRYRWAATAVAALIATLSIGVAAAMWQANRANREAQRATATRDFLISVFRESDPRIARDRPPGEITAKELLDASVNRIEKEFAADPETQLTLLALASEIYGYWADEPRFMELLQKRTDLARRHYGPTHPTVIESRLIDAWGSIYTQDYPEAQRILSEADALIRDGGHDDSVLRARWWLARGEAVRTAGPLERLTALDRAVELFARVAPEDVDHAVALANSGSAHFARENYAESRQRTERALDLFVNAKDRSDADVAGTYANLARSLQHLGEFDAAERAYERSAELTRKTGGERSGQHWRTVADHARLVHLRGERERAHRMFDALLKLISPDWKLTTDDVIAREYYAERLAAEGRAAEAIPMLEAAERTYIERPLREYDLRRVRQTLGDAYDRVGRIDDARRTLRSARDERIQKDAPASFAVLAARERWARFLLTQGELQAALDELQEIVSVGAGKVMAPVALAHADLATLAIQRQDPGAALAESRRALAVLERSTGLYDVRIGPEIWRTHAAVLRLGHDLKGADEWYSRALAASRRYDHPSSPTVQVAARTSL
ncbi:MAG: protein kinase domain-containing protein [Gammaproteobacteria bacterium]